MDNPELEERLHELSLLFELTSSLGASPDLDQSLDQFLERLARATGAEVAAVFTPPDGVGPSAQARLRRALGIEARRWSLCVPQQLADLLAAEPHRVHAVAGNLLAALAPRGRALESGIATLLRIGDRTVGVLLVARFARHTFAPGLVRMFASMAGRVAFAVDHQWTTGALRATTQRLEALIEHLPSGVLSEDDARRITHVNQRFCEMLGLGTIALVGTSCADAVVAVKHLFVDPPRFIERIEETLAGGVVVIGEELRLVDGRILERDFVPIRRADGGVECLWNFRDVTSVRRTNDQLLLSDRMASIGTVSAGVAHEINNPLAAVIANLDLAASEIEELVAHPGSGRQLVELEEMIREAREAASRVRFIVRDLKTLSRSEVDVRGPVDVHQVIESSLRMAGNEIRHRATVVRDYGVIPMVLANDARLGQVLLNLIMNAGQAIPPGHANDNEVRIRTSTDATGRAVVEIIDTGCGMPFDLLQKLFVPFFTTKPAGVGTGLGLAICQRIINDLGGEIAVTSELGRGTTFRVSLIAAPTIMPSAAAVETVTASTRHRAKILIIDDDTAVANTIRRVLAKQHDVICSSCGEEPLRWIAGGERYDLILCDLMMPVVTGMELHERLRGFAPEQADRIVFITGGAFTTEARAFLAGLANPCIDKPFDLRRLREFVDERLRALGDR